MFRSYQEHSSPRTQEIIPGDTRKQVLRFLKSLDPRIATSTYIKQQYVEKYLVSAPDESEEITPRFNTNPLTWKQFSEDTGLPIEATLHQTTFKKVRGLDNEWYGEYIFPSDSNVYLLAGGKHVVKFYFSLGKDEIEKYYIVQNRMAERSYHIESSGMIEGEEYSSIEVNVLRLNPENLIGTQYSTIALIEAIGIGETKELSLEIDERKKIANAVIKTIWEENNYYGTPPTLHNMNMRLTGIKDGVLQVVVTDMGDFIESFLERTIDYKRQKSPHIGEIVGAKVRSILQK